MLLFDAQDFVPAFSLLCRLWHVVLYAYCNIPRQCITDDECPFRQQMSIRHPAVLRSAAASRSHDSHGGMARGVF